MYGVLLISLVNNDIQIVQLFFIRFKGCKLCPIDFKFKL